MEDPTDPMDPIKVDATITSSAENLKKQHELAGSSNSSVNVSRQNLDQERIKSLKETGRRDTYRQSEAGGQYVLSLDLLNPDLNGDGRVDRYEAEVYNVLKAADADGDG